MQSESEDEEVLRNNTSRNYIDTTTAKAHITDETQKRASVDPFVGAWSVACVPWWLVPVISGAVVAA